VVLFRESLNYFEVIGIVLAVESLVLLMRFASDPRQCLGKDLPVDEANGPTARQLRRACHSTLDSIQVPGSLVRLASSRSRPPAVLLFNASRGLSLSR
jgi:hypothetical protein